MVYVPEFSAFFAYPGGIDIPGYTGYPSARDGNTNVVSPGRAIVFTLPTDVHGFTVYSFGGLASFGISGASWVLPFAPQIDGLGGAGQAQHVALPALPGGQLAVTLTDFVNNPGSYAFDGIDYDAPDPQPWESGWADQGDGVWAFPAGHFLGQYPNAHAGVAMVLSGTASTTASRAIAAGMSAVEVHSFGRGSGIAYWNGAPLGAVQGGGSVAHADMFAVPPTAGTFAIASTVDGGSSVSDGLGGASIALDGAILHPAAAPFPRGYW